MSTVTALTSHTFQSAATGTGDGTYLGTSTVSELVIQVSGITTATITFEASLDGGTTYSPVKASPQNGSTGATTTTANGIFRLTVPAFYYQRVRCRISAYTSGTILVKGLYG